MLTVTLSSKGQVVLPKLIREKLGLQEGDTLTVTLEENSVRLTPTPTTARGWQKWRGVLAGTAALEDHLADHAEELKRDRLP
jgi:AbrB family looped-hinge helix DNA binding protein